MQEGDRSYILSCCITSVIPSWGTGVPLSRLECLGKKRQEKATKTTQGCKNGSLSNRRLKSEQKIRSLCFSRLSWNCRHKPSDLSMGDNKWGWPILFAVGFTRRPLKALCGGIWLMAHLGWCLCCSLTHLLPGLPLRCSGSKPDTPSQKKRERGSCGSAGTSVAWP